MDQLVPKDVAAALKLIEHEVMRTWAKRHPMCSQRDGYAHLLESVDALWATVKTNPGAWTQLREDAVRIAATAVCFVLDITDVDDARFIKAQQEGS